MQRTDLAKPPAANAVHVHSPQQEASVRAGGKRRAALALPLTAVAALVVILAALVGWYELSHADRVYSGVQVLGRDLGGMTPSEASAALSQAGSVAASDVITVKGDGREWRFTAEQLGVAVDTDRTLEQALAVGRDGGALDNLATQAGSLTGGREVAATFRADPTLVTKAVESIAAEVDHPAVDSRLEKIADGTVQVTPSSSGSLLDREALVASIGAAVQARPFANVTASLKVQQPGVTESELEGAKAQAMLLTEQPVVLSLGEDTWTVEPTGLREMLTLEHNGANVTAALDPAKVEAFLAKVAGDVYMEPVDAALSVGKSAVVLDEDKSGRELDVKAASQMIAEAAAKADGREVALPTKEIAASVHTADLKPLYDKADSLVTQGIRLRFRDDGYTIRGSAVAGFLDVAPAQGGPGPLKLTIDRDVLANRISGVAYYINTPAVDAIFKMVNGAPSKVAEAKEGVKVDIEQSVNNAVSSIEGYAGGDKLQVDLAATVTEPAIKEADLASISTPDLLSYGQTSYKGSSANRAVNVELGAAKIDGTLIPPGGEFSTVETIGPLTLDAGFKMGYAIMSNGQGGLTTVPAEAGGICQVSTTLFHAVFRGGLQITERNWHSYWIGSYGVAPTGLPGLDATIAPPEKDFRFKNNTGNWLLIKAIAGQGTIKFELHGTNPHWNVAIGEPVITNRVKTSQEPVIEYSAELPKSAGKVMVEHAQDGFDASITRVVTEANGNVIDKWVAKSSYKPAYNRYLIGTGKEK